jgi:hypothetical protein
VAGVKLCPPIRPCTPHRAAEPQGITNSPQDRGIDKQRIEIRKLQQFTKAQSSLFSKLYSSGAKYARIRTPQPKPANKEGEAATGLAFSLFSKPSYNASFPGIS